MRRRSPPPLCAALWPALSAAAAAQCPSSPTDTLPYGTASARLGSSVAVSGVVAAAGAPNDLGSSGSVLLFRHTGTQWGGFGFLKPSDLEDGNAFGHAVALAGNVLVVGAPGGEGVVIDAGAAYVYRYDGTTWVEEQKLFASDGATGERFGESVATDGTVVVVGCSEDDPTGADSGSAYVFRYDGVAFVEEQKLFAEDGTAGARFGSAVALSGPTILCGAPGDDDLGRQSGSAYVFADLGGTWDELQKLLAGNGADQDMFGSSVGLDGTLAVVGAPFAASATGLFVGAAYVFDLVAGSWQETQALSAPGLASGDLFGTAVAVDGGNVVVAAPLHDVAGALDAGRAFLYRRNSAWLPFQQLNHSTPAAGDRFAAAVAIDGAWVIAGAPLDDASDVDAGTFLAFVPPGLEPLWLAASDLAPDAGDPLAFSTCGGLPAARGKLYLVDVNGVPTFLKVASGKFDAFGTWTSADTVPPGLGGLVASFLTLGFIGPGDLAASNVVAIAFP